MPFDGAEVVNRGADCAAKFERYRACLRSIIEECVEDRSHLDADERPPSAPLVDAVAFRDCPECPEMVEIPAGVFSMGSPDGVEDEGPQHGVAIKAPLAVGRYEITFEEWDACVLEQGCVYIPADHGWGRGARPVIHVSWEDAQGYLRWLSEKTGRTYRLLSEAEWEYAARAGSGTPFHTGEQISTDQANFDGNFTFNGSSKGASRQQTLKAGSFAPNAWGLYDMHGNVWEWVQDCWHDSYEDAPSDGAAWMEAADGDCSVAVLRGGSWNFKPDSLRSTSRGWNRRNYRNFDIGFRVVRTVDK
ncbi:MAG: formylglycine-generating enzyme family protein [Rhodobacteraceae bacterium]|nr:formylglycine-generating enzyme family protein [Paracoccaceae bacterium]